jgi:hypothetical protein
MLLTSSVAVAAKKRLSTTRRGVAASIAAWRRRNGMARRALHRWLKHVSASLLAMGPGNLGMVATAAASGKQAAAAAKRGIC